MRYIKLPPELADGEHWTPVSANCTNGLTGPLRDWASQAEPGETITLEIIELTDEELDALPAI